MAEQQTWYALQQGWDSPDNPAAVEDHAFEETPPPEPAPPIFKAKTVPIPPRVTRTPRRRCHFTPAFLGLLREIGLDEDYPWGAKLPTPPPMTPTPSPPPLPPPEKTIEAREPTPEEVMELVPVPGPERTKDAGPVWRPPATESVFKRTQKAFGRELKQDRKERRRLRERRQEVQSGQFGRRQRQQQQPPLRQQTTAGATGVMPLPPNSLSSSSSRQRGSTTASPRRLASVYRAALVESLGAELEEEDAEQEQEQEENEKEKEEEEEEEQQQQQQQQQKAEEVGKETEKESNGSNNGDDHSYIGDQADVDTTASSDPAEYHCQIIRQREEQWRRCQEEDHRHLPHHASWRGGRVGRAADAARRVPTPGTPVPHLVSEYTAVPGGVVDRRSGQRISALRSKGPRPRRKSRGYDPTVPRRRPVPMPRVEHMAHFTGGGASSRSRPAKSPLGRGGGGGGGGCGGAGGVGADIKNSRLPRVFARPSNRGRHNRPPSTSAGGDPLLAEDPGLSQLLRTTRDPRKIAKEHGTLNHDSLRALTKTWGYNRHELILLFVRFKALCGMSSDSCGIDRETFKRAVPLLAVEDSTFVERVFDVLDANDTASIDWEEFLQMMSALESGSEEHRTKFLFRIYDRDGDGWITRADLFHFFAASLMVKMDDNIKEITNTFIDSIFKTLDPTGVGRISLEMIRSFLVKNPGASIYSVLGRSMASQAAHHNFKGQ